VFVESGGTWSQQAKLTASDGAALDQFGHSVAVSGSTIVVGAPHHPFSLAGNGLGAAYVFVENGGAWSQQAELKASDGVAGDNFGDSVAVSGSTEPDKTETFENRLLGPTNLFKRLNFALLDLRLY
jgi:hypothetical protein